MMKKICVVTGTRAEYGLLKPVIRKILADQELELLLYVTGAHLSPEFGLTYQEIEQDGIPIHRKIEMLLSADTPGSILKSMGVELMGFADGLAEDKPDMMLLLGDRYECMAAAVAAMIYRLPIAHIHGGELTEGAVDEAIRHSITKMSYLHFAATEEYRKRIIQLGEEPQRVFYVGSLGAESIKKLELLNKEELQKQINFQFDRQTAMVTYHPVTLENNSSGEQFAELLMALEEFQQMRFIFTKANSDAEGRIINKKIDEFVEKNKDRCITFDSMGQLRYLSSLQFCSMVIGNSSSGIIEAPSFHIPTINIGDRQKGRTSAGSVINCGNTKEEISKAICMGLTKEFKERIKLLENPYEKENTSDCMIAVIKTALKQGINIKKKFYDWEQ